MNTKDLEIKYENTNFHIDLNIPIVCPECGKNDFYFQTINQEAEIFATTPDFKTTHMGVTCANCKAGFTLNLNLVQ